MRGLSVFGIAVVSSMGTAAAGDLPTKAPPLAGGL